MASPPRRPTTRVASLARPFSARPLDVLWIAFFVIHLIASVLVDSQVFLPTKWVPKPLADLLAKHIKDSNDVLISAAMQGNPRYLWFKTALVSEMVFQLPVFFFGSIGLWNDDARIYPVIIAYSSLATITTLQCLVAITLGPERSLLSSSELQANLGAYIPFSIIPFAMGVDLIIRTTRLLSRAQTVVGNVERLRMRVESAAERKQR